MIRWLWSIYVADKPNTAQPFEISIDKTPKRMAQSAMYAHVWDGIVRQVKRICSQQ